MATTTAKGRTNRKIGIIEAAIRKLMKPGMMLGTVPGRASFEIREFSDDALVLLFGEKKTSTSIPWSCLEGVMQRLVQGDWVEIRSVHDTTGVPGSVGWPYQVERWTTKNYRGVCGSGPRGGRNCRGRFGQPGQGSAQQGHYRRRAATAGGRRRLGNRPRRPVLTCLWRAEGHRHDRAWDRPGPRLPVKNGVRRNKPVADHLLDACAVIWIARGDPLREPATHELRETHGYRARLFVSPITAWENCDAGGEGKTGA